MSILRLILCVVYVALVSAFCPSPTRTHYVYRYSIHSSSSSSSSLHLVTEEDVIALVEKAEDLWGKVEQLRTTSKELSMQAEEMGEDAESSASEVMKGLTQKKIDLSAEKIADLQQAQSQSLDLGSLLDKAAQATEEADEIESLANEALASSEAALEQHLIDFPENA